MWAGAHDLGSVSNTAGPVSPNVGQSPLPISANLVPESLRISGPAADDLGPLQVAADMRNVLGIGPGTGRNGTWEQHLADLFERCEDAGIWIMRTGYVGSNTHRTLSTADFRGFAIADKLAPIVFINGRDAKAAQAFTLAHELAHIWLGASGVSNPALDRRTDGSGNIELVCNAIAAEVLVPRALLMKSWDGSRSLAANAQSLSQVFKVSRVVIARRALDCGKIGWNEYRAYFEQERRSWQVPDEPGGGDFYRNAPIKNGRRFARAVLNSAMSGQLLFQDAGNLLHMKPGTVRKFYDRSLSER
ncbi:ImmA/IrrE family metallo-endopeptidase (plasmid) [Skermanella rosea]|uniref:ImmA/IrrE family metallo-endopeptidase n=1 Tax=Skermanella rosea TaxID=1817965 RepID=UPI001E63C3FC|nr:ImmA/IrrE family metallo-endopeptidase [Skermanella rosea]UEM07802.1 ImmA/IrrE family metallo-endopeptidase [Skermanella rosea]